MNQNDLTFSYANLMRPSKKSILTEAVKLSSKRSKVSSSIEKKVTEILRSLGMSESIFKIEITKGPSDASRGSG